MSSMIYYRIQYTHTRENVIYLLINIYMHISLTYAYFILVVHVRQRGGGVAGSGDKALGTRLHVRQPCNTFCWNVYFNVCFWMLKIVFKPDDRGEGSAWLLTRDPEPKVGLILNKTENE